MSKSSAPNTIEIAGQPAVISYVPELGAFRGKFLGLTGYCDFVSDSIQGLKKEETFTLRYPESFGERLNQAAAEHEISVNSFIIEALNERMKHV